MSMTNKEAIKMLKSKMDGHTDTSYEWAETVSLAIKALEEQRPRGEWEKYGDKIEAYDIEGHKTWGQKRRCTNCGFIHTYIEDFGIYPFCPNCNALMYKEGDNNEK